MASAPTNPQRLLILKPSMTSSLLIPVDSWSFLLLWDIWHHCLLSFLKSSLTSCRCVGHRYSHDFQIVSPTQPSPWGFKPTHQRGYTPNSPPGSKHSIYKMGLIYFSPKPYFPCAPIAKSEARESALTSPPTPTLTAIFVLYFFIGKPPFWAIY